MENSSQLDDLFNCAASFVQTQALADDGKKLDQSQQLEIYGLYKSAIIGPCNEPRPGMFNPKGRAKWDAWKQVSDLTKAEAQQAYVDKVKLLYDWVPPEITPHNENSGANKNMSGFGGIAVSSMLKPEEAEDDGTDPIVFKWAKDNDIAKIISWIIDGNDVNLKDSTGLSLLHWVVDRGHIDACRILLSNGANPLIADEDGQTPLDYAITCEHESIIDLLKESIMNKY